MIFGQFDAMRQKNSNSSILRAMIRCIRQTEFVVNTCVTAQISIIDTFVGYVVIQKKILSNLFSQELSQTSAGMVMSRESRKCGFFSMYRNKSLKAGIESCYYPPS